MDRINFINLFNTFRTQLLTMSTRNIWRFIWDLISNRITNIFIFRIVTNLPGINPNDLINSKSKKIFWLSFASVLVFYKMFTYFKRLILWPFKLGIYTFLFSISGIDLSWFLSWFDSFPLNIPQWVYLQYLSLYNNWLSWWNNTVNVKSLNNIPMPSIPKVNSDLVESDNTDSKIFNKKKYYYRCYCNRLNRFRYLIFFYSGNGGTGEGGDVNPNLPPNPPHNINIIDNQTPNRLIIDFDRLTPDERTRLWSTVELLRDADRISQERYDYYREILLGPAPGYEGPTVDLAYAPVVDSTPSIITQPNPEYDQYFGNLNNNNSSSTLFNPVTNDNSTASGSDTTSDSQIPAGIPAIEVVPSTPIETPSTPIDSQEPSSIAAGQDNHPNPDIERSVSPSGSIDSNETVRPYSYGGQGEPTRYAIPRRPFDPVYRRNND